jgi:hypothetical protein
MSRQLTTLPILPMNKTVVFYSPLEDKDILVRTGTIGDGSCFYHAILHAYSIDYIHMNVNNRMKFVKNLRESIAQKVDKASWESLSNGLISKIPFQENVNTILCDFYKYIIDKTTDPLKSISHVIRKVIIDRKIDIEAYTLITEIVPLDTGFEKNILPSAGEKNNFLTISDCKKIIINQSVVYITKELERFKGRLSDNKIKYYVEKLRILVKEVVDEADNLAYSDYIKSISDVSTSVDSYTIGLISENLNRNIYFIDARNRMPYRYIIGDKIIKRKSIIVIWTGSCHYEIVGRLLPGNRIQREFDYKDSLIKKISTYLYKPEKIPDEYPTLIPYLPKNLRKKLGIELSDSEEERRSASTRSDHDGTFINSIDV